MIKLTTPLTKEDIINLKAGDVVYLTGTIYTARDAAHKRILSLIENNEPTPFDLMNSIIYYTGPTPAQPGKIIGSCGPTSRYRLDAFMDTFRKRGQVASIGKCDRNDSVIEACKKYQMIYFLATGGIGAKLSTCVKKCQIIAFQDLGAEAVRELYVEDFPLIVGYDTYGNSIFGGKEND